MSFANYNSRDGRGQDCHRYHGLKRVLRWPPVATGDLTQKTSKYGVFLKAATKAARGARSLLRDLQSAQHGPALAVDVERQPQFPVDADAANFLDD